MAHNKQIMLLLDSYLQSLLSPLKKVENIIVVVGRKYINSFALSVETFFKSKRN